jgi:beta-lactamase superfamily II metal-dependent hydrolase
MLLTGDARGDKILEGLEKVKLLKPRGKMHEDILKVPHHGSSRNMEPIFFERITADHYV